MLDMLRFFVHSYQDLDYAKANVREKIRDVTTSLSFLQVNSLKCNRKSLDVPHPSLTGIRDRQEYVQTPIYSWIDAVDAFNASANAGRLRECAVYISTLLAE
jgi:hypothetical protein